MQIPLLGSYILAVPVVGGRGRLPGNVRMLLADCWLLIVSVIRAAVSAAGTAAALRAFAAPSIDVFGDTDGAMSAIRGSPFFTGILMAKGHLNSAFFPELLTSTNRGIRCTPVHLNQDIIDAYLSVFMPLVPFI